MDHAGSGSNVLAMRISLNPNGTPKVILSKPCTAFSSALVTCPVKSVPCLSNS